MIEFKDLYKEFPLLTKEKSNSDYIYFDNAATSQRPKFVLDVMNEVYESANANVHRGIHRVSNYASILYEKSHEIVADFINAQVDEVFFVNNSTEGLNYIAQGLASKDKFNLKRGDVIAIPISEHHSNILPWLKIAKEKELIIEWLNLDENFLINIGQLETILETYKEKLRIVAVNHISNVLGSKNDIKKISELTHKYGGLLIVDAAQSIAHIPIDVKLLDVDFLVFSGHKIYGPFGSGVVFGKKAFLQKLDPFIVGGGMIKDVEKDGADWQDIPWRFEAGTPNVVGGIGLASAILWLNSTLSENLLMNHNGEVPLLDFIANYQKSNVYTRRLLTGWNNLIDHELELMQYAIKKLSDIKSVNIFGPIDANQRFGVLSFTIENIHPHDIASMLDEYGIAIRAGMHCTHILHREFNIKSTSRISFGMYNTFEEIDFTIDKLAKIIDLMS